MQCPHCRSEVVAYKTEGERSIVGWTRRGVFKGKEVWRCDACEGGILIGRWGRVRGIPTDAWLEIEDARRRLEHRQSQDAARAAKRTRRQG